MYFLYGNTIVTRNAYTPSFNALFLNGKSSLSFSTQLRASTSFFKTINSLSTYILRLFSFDNVSRKSLKYSNRFKNSLTFYLISLSVLIFIYFKKVKY